MVNMAVALAITANARIFMSRVKNNPDIKLFYTDTDSAFTGNLLPDDWYHPNKTGFYKLENVVNNFVALGPKVYGAIKEDGSSFTKVKGFKGIIPLRTLTEALDSRNPQNVKHELMFNFINKGHIIEKETSYLLTPTLLKRELVFVNNILVGTTNKIVGNLKW
uniref:Uncharacterized protein n=1 Tax=Porodaedalea pini TaxID=108901 RepID=A0A5B9RCG5_9AGAM|nr:hypothetical protein PPIT_000104 [Porodaedalea pini]QEG56999.1 hypothetical protein PPIT_000104 [Porodaedalea pini]